MTPNSSGAVSSMVAGPAVRRVTSCWIVVYCTFLPAFDRLAQDVGDRLEEVGIVGGEGTVAHGMGAEHSVRPLEEVDHRADTGHDPVIAKKRRRFESRFGPEVVEDDRCSHAQRVARLGLPFRGNR